MKQNIQQFPKSSRNNPIGLSDTSLLILRDIQMIGDILGIKENLQLMKTLDDAWNAGPDRSLWETFKKRHREDVKVYWPATASHRWTTQP